MWLLAHSCLTCKYSPKCPPSDCCVLSGWGLQYINVSLHTQTRVRSRHPGRRRHRLVCEAIVAAPAGQHCHNSLSEFDQCYSRRKRRRSCSTSAANSHWWAKRSANTYRKLACSCSDVQLCGPAWFIAGIQFVACCQRSNACRCAWLGP